MNRYISSRNRNDIVTAHQAIIKGLSNDGGLYTIENITAHIDPSEVLHLSYQQTAEKILSVAKRLGYIAEKKINKIKLVVCR